MSGSSTRTSGRSSAYSLAVGVAVGAAMVGLVLPFAVGDDAGTSPSIALGSDGSSDGRSTGDDGAFDGSPATIAENGTGDPAPGAPSGGNQPSGSTPSSPGGSAKASSSPTQGIASDRGVTATSLKVGVVLLDLTTVRALGLSPEHYSLDTQRRSYEVEIDAINASGIHGRQIEAAYTTSDVLQPDTSLAACSTLTEDQDVFLVAAFAGFSSDGMLCVGQRHETPIVVFGWPPDEIFDKTAGRLISDGMSTTRMMFNWVNELHRLNLLAGKKIGIVGTESTVNGDKQAVEAGLLPALREFGYDVTYRARLSADLHTAASQMPVEVQRMRTAGVDNVMFVSSPLTATQWAQNAENQGWRPQYHVSDHQSTTCDICIEDMPASFDGAIGITERHFVRGAREGMPEPEPDRQCRERYNKATGESWAYGVRHPFYNVCLQMEMVRRTLLAAGPNPTRATWTANARNVGAFPVATMYGGGLTGRSSFADTVVTIRWDESCTDSPRTDDVEDGCYRTQDQPRRTRY